MTHNELIQTPEYWTAKIQIELFQKVEEYIKNNNLTRTQFAEKLGVSKGYISQILNGDFDHRISKLVEIALAIGYFPSFSMEKQDTGFDSFEIEEIKKNISTIHKRLEQNGYRYNTLFCKKQSELTNNLILEIKNNQKEKTDSNANKVA